METLRVIVPGLYGYRLDTPNGGNYWGKVGQDPAYETTKQGFPRHSGAGEYAGVLVVQVVPGGPGDRAGLHAGDVILAVGGEPTPSVDLIHRVLSREAIGRRLDMEVLRDGQKTRLGLLVEERPAA